MSTIPVVANGRVHALAPEEPAPLGVQLWALVTGRAVDELTGAPPAAPLRITPARRGIWAKYADDGHFALVARPFHAFAALTAPEHPLAFTLAAAGYLPQSLRADIRLYSRHLVATATAGARSLILDDTGGLRAGQALLLGPHEDAEWTEIDNVGPGPGELRLAAGTRRAHPGGAAVAADEFLPVELGDVALHRAPVVLCGRTVRHDAGAGAAAPVAGARVVVSGTWRTLDEVRRMLPPQPAAMVALAPGLYAPRPAGATLEALALVPALGEDKRLLADAAPGAAALRLSGRGALTAGTLLLVDPDQPDIAEYLRIADIAGSAGADEAATVHLEFPLRWAHRPGARVLALAPQPPAPARHFTAAGLAGDATVLLDDIGGLETASAARIGGGGAPDEYQRIGVYVADSDIQGYFRLPALTRAAQLRLRASSPGLAPLTCDFRPVYDDPDANRLDLRFPN